MPRYLYGDDPMRPVSFTLPEELITEVKDAAKARRVPASAVVRDALHAFFNGDGDDA